LTAVSSKSTGAARFSDSNTSSKVYESLPPDRHTMTRSPGTIMR
jgi:hypothetical protein